MKGQSVSALTSLPPSVAALAAGAAPPTATARAPAQKEVYCGSPHRARSRRNVSSTRSTPSRPMPCLHASSRGLEAPCESKHPESRYLRPWLRSSSARASLPHTYMTAVGKVWTPAATPPRAPRARLPPPRSARWDFVAAALPRSQPPRRAGEPKSQRCGTHKERHAVACQARGRGDEELARGGQRCAPRPARPPPLQRRAPVSFALTVLGLRDRLRDHGAHPQAAGGRV